MFSAFFLQKVPAFEGVLAEMSDQEGPQSSALVPVRVKAVLLARLDDWIAKQDHKPSRPEAIRELLEQVLGTDAAIAEAQSKELDTPIEHLEATVADLKPKVSGKPRPETGMAMLRKAKAKNELAKAKNKRAGQDGNYS